MSANISKILKMASNFASLAQSLNQSQNQQIPQWVSDFKSSKVPFLLEGNNVIGFGLSKLSNNLNLSQVAADGRAKNGIVLGAAKYNNINVQNYNVTLSNSSQPEYYIDQSAKIVYAMVSAPLSNVQFSAKQNIQPAQQTSNRQANKLELDRNFDGQQSPSSEKKTQRQPRQQENSTRGRAESAFDGLDREFDN